MVSSTRQLLKDNLTLADFGGDNEAPLSIQQIAIFLRLAITSQAMLPDVRMVTSNANKWQESKINVDNRIMRAASELTRLGDTDRYSPSTGIIELSTVLLRGEVPISDEVLEDQVEREGFGSTVMTMVAEGAGRDIEDLMVNGDNSIFNPETSTADTGKPSSNDTNFATQVGVPTATTGTGSVSDATYFRAMNQNGSAGGWLAQALRGANGNVTNAGGSNDYQDVFANLLAGLPDRYKRDKANMRFYVPDTLEELYRDTLASRGTPLGDAMLQGDRPLTYQAIPIKSVPIMRVTSDDSTYVLLTHRLNLYAGFRRQIKMETWRDPREGGTSFVVSTRVDAKVAHVPATAVAHNVDVSR